MATVEAGNCLDPDVLPQEIPLSRWLSPEQSLAADLLRARAEREQGVEGAPVERLLAEMNRIIAEAEQGK